MAWGLDAVYLLAVGLLQAFLGYLIWRAGRRRTVHTAIGLVLALSAIQTLNLLASALDAWNLPAGTRRLTDTLILGTLVYLLTQLPTPIGGEHGARTSKKVWIGVLGAWALASQVLIATLGPEHVLYDASRSVLHEGAFAAIAGLFVLRFVPRWLDTEPGPLRTQSLFAGVAAAVTAFDQGTRWLGSILASPAGILEPGGLGGALHDVTAWFVVAGIARVGYAAVRSRDRDCWLLTVLLLAAAGMGAYRIARDSFGAVEMAAQVFRPLLFAVAMLRFELVDVPTHERRWAVPVASISLAGVVFLMLVGILSPGGLDAQALEPASALVAVVLLGGLAWVSRPVLRIFDPDAPAGDRGPILDRYRLALERARGAGDGEDLATLRETLGVTDREHELMRSLVESRTLVDTRHLTPAEPGDVVADRYEIERELGRGGQGRALTARDRETDQRVVLKEVLRPWEEGAESRRRALQREVDLAGGLDAPGLASVHGLVEQGPRVYLVRDYVEGDTLDELIAREAPLDPGRAIGVVDRIAESIAHLHDEGLLHLDLKPSNIVLADDGTPVVIDHGTVQKLRTGQEATRTATVGASTLPVGTLAWMAPEQVLEQPVDERTDVFALGALLYHLATGRRHVEVDDRPRYAIEDDIVRGELPPDAPDPLGEVIEACLARDPDQRPASVDALRELLARASGRSPSLLPEDQQAATDADDVAGA